MIRNSKWGVWTLVGLLLLSGCDLLPEPASLIRAPSTASADAQKEENIVSLAKKHLPRGTAFSVPSGPIGEDAVMSADFNRDGKDEVVILYHSRDSQSQVGAFVLQEKEEGWQKSFAVKGSGYEISWASSNDVTGDGVKELLLGWKVGNLAGNVLEVYQWDDGEFTLLKKLNYHQFEILHFDEDPQVRLAIWKKDVVDVFEVDLLKWEGNDFILDEVHYPSYFPRVVQYYQRRTESVPDAAYYWYYLADAQLKANNPENALRSISKGMEQKIVIPPYEKFNELKEKIEVVLANTEENFLYEVRDAHFTMSVPKEEVGNLAVKQESGADTSYIVTVTKGLDHWNPLFKVRVYSKEMYSDSGGVQLEQIGETDEWLFFIEKEEIDSDDIPNKEAALIDKMVSSIKPGLLHPQYRSLEEDSIIKLVKEATQKYWYVVSGGESESEQMEFFSYDGLDYRYMGRDLDTMAKLSRYLSESFTSDSIQSFVKRLKIIEQNGRLAQPNADGGSLANYDKASVVQISGNSDIKKIDMKVPLGSSLSYELVSIEIQKTEDGWRISSEPGTF